MISAANLLLAQVSILLRMSSSEEEGMHDSKRIRLQKHTDTSDSVRRLEKATNAVSDDVLYEIFSQLGTLDLINASQVCHQWRLVSTAPILWLNRVELRGTFQQIDRQWSIIKSNSREGSLVTDLCVHHAKRNMCATQDDMEENWWKGSFLKSFPFKTVETIHYYGVADAVDLFFWTSLIKCEKLQRLFFRSRFNAYYSIPNSEDLCSFNFKWEMNSKLRYLEIDYDYDYHTDHLPFQHLETLIFKIIRLPSEVRGYLRSASDTLIELQIWGVNHNDVDEDTIQGEGDSGSEFAYTADSPIYMPRLQIFRAIYIDTDRSRDWDQRETMLRGMTKVSYDIEAPNVTEMVYDRFLGWDQVLFESCHLRLRKVSWEVNDYNLMHMYKAIEHLPACEELCIKMATSYRHHWPNLWLGERPDGPSIVRSLCLPKLKTLAIIDDNIIDGDELIRLVEHKRSNANHTLLSTLSLKDCYRIRNDAVVKLRKLVQDVDYTLSEY